MAAVDVRRLRCHRRVEVERQQRDQALLDEPVELPDDLLGPTDRERRHEQDALGLVHELDGLGEDPDRFVLRLVFAATVRRLDEDVVRGGHDGRVAEDRRAGPAEVAGADDDPLLAAVAILDDEPDDRRAQDVAGIEERRLDARRDLALLVVVDRPEVLERPLRVLDRVQRRVEVDLERRRLSTQVLLGIARPGAGGAGFGLDAGRDVLAGLRGDGLGQRPQGVRRSLAGAHRRSRPRPPLRSRPPRQGRPRPGTSPPPCGRRPRPRRDGASPSAPRAWRTPRGGAPSRAGRASRARRCPAVAWIGPL